jgi:glycosyltransferase involved in cell wall biosynthesis
MHLLRTRIIPESADFRLLSRRVVEEFKKIKERNIFIRGLIPYLGFNHTIVYYKRGKRAAGNPSYSFKKLLSLAIDGITSFSYFPLRLATIFGFLVAISSFTGIIWVLFVKLLGLTEVKGWASIILPIFFLGGIQLIFLGIIGEYIGKIYIETKRRPLFIIKEIFSKEKVS